MQPGASMLTELGKRLVSQSLSDLTLQRATEDTPDFAILPWVNMVKVGGQSIMDRGRSAVMPLIDEIVANLPRHKMILGTGAGTRARHIYSLAIDLGLPVGVLTVLGTAVAWQNAQMLQYLLARHGIAFLEPEGFASLPHYLMERGAVIVQGMPPYKLWQENPAIGRIPPQRTDTGCFLIASATITANSGTPATKLRVPSMGSIIHTGCSPPICAITALSFANVSSPTTTDPGKLRKMPAAI